MVLLNPPAGTRQGPDRRAGGRRLDADARRDQLTRIGVELARRVPPDQISADEVARAAGVSKGLVFHYFPTTRDLQVAVLRSSTAELLARLGTDHAAAPSDRLLTGINAFVAYIEEHPAGYLATARGIGSDPGSMEVFEETRAGVVDIMRRALGTPELPAGLRIAIRGWIAMVEESVLHWVEDHPVPRDQLVAFLHRAALDLMPQAMAMGAGTLVPTGPADPAVFDLRS